jgi:transposase-like protein
MTDETGLALDELLRAAEMSDNVNFLREGIQALAQAPMEAEVTQQLGAHRYERGPEQTGECNGSRERGWDMRVGSITRRAPLVRDVRSFPSLVEPWRRVEQAQMAVAQGAYARGVLTRWVDELAYALSLSGIDKSQVSLPCVELDGEVERIGARSLDTSACPHVWLDAPYVKARTHARVAGQAVVIAIGLHAQTGNREALGLDIVPSVDGAFWLVVRW